MDILLALQPKCEQSSMGTNSVFATEMSWKAETNDDTPLVRGRRPAGTGPGPAARAFLVSIERKRCRSKSARRCLRQGASSAAARERSIGATLANTACAVAASESCQGARRASRQRLGPVCARARLAVQMNCPENNRGLCGGENSVCYSAAWFE